MSARRAGKRPPLPVCGACGRRIPKHMERKKLTDGRLVCDRCIGAGVLVRRLSCGHMSTAGQMVLSESSDYSNTQCPQCSGRSPFRFATVRREPA